MPTPCAASRSIRPKSVSISVWLRADVGSSIAITVALCDSALATSTS